MMHLIAGTIFEFDSGKMAYWQSNQISALTLSVPQDFHGCTKPFFIYAQNIMVYNLTAHNYVSLKDNPNKIYIKLRELAVLYKNVK